MVKVTTTDRVEVTPSGYRRKGVLLQRTTGIIDLLGQREKSDRLKDWAGRCALKSGFAESWRDELDFAGRAGTKGHELIEGTISAALLSSGLLDESEVCVPEVHHGDSVTKVGLQVLESWGRWLEKRAIPEGFVPVAAEVQIFSESLGFAGTLDCLAYRNGGLYVHDWKSSSRIDKLTHAMQLVAYAALLEEECCLAEEGRVILKRDAITHGVKARPIELDGGYVVRCDKKKTTFEELLVPVSDFGPLWKLFSSLLEVGKALEGVKRHG